MRLSFFPNRSSQANSLQPDTVQLVSNRERNNIAPACAFEACANTALTRGLQVRAGVTVGKLRYCGIDCFAEASRGRLAALSGASVIEMRRRPRLSIGLVLLSQGHVTEDQLRSSMAESQQTGEAVEAALLRLGLITERKVVAARAAQWGCPVLSRDHEPQHVEFDIPPTLLDRCSAVPLHYSTTSKRALLGFVHRVEHSLLGSMESITGLRTDPCFITATEFNDQKNRVSLAPDCEEVVFDESQTLGQMAKNVGGFASEIAANQAGFARCRDYVWTRIVGKKKKIDLLFRIDATAQAGKNTDSPLPQEGIRSLG